VQCVGRGHRAPLTAALFLTADRRIPLGAVHAVGHDVLVEAARPRLVNLVPLRTDPELLQQSVLLFFGAFPNAGRHMRPRFENILDVRSFGHPNGWFYQKLPWTPTP
jgi:hypothetical protein